MMPSGVGKTQQGHTAHGLRSLKARSMQASVAWKEAESMAT